VKRLLVVALILMVISNMTGCSKYFPDEEEAATVESETWLTAPLEVDMSHRQVFFAGPNLSNQVGAIQAYTYCDPGNHVTLIWEGYEEKTQKNIWSLPNDFEQENPNCSETTKWSVDFLWPAKRGAYPPGAQPGTSRFSITTSTPTGQ
jgi:hypothetical protein